MKRQWIDIRKDRPGADVRDRFGGGEEAVGGDNHLVAGPDSGRLESQLQGVGSGGHAHGVARANVASQVSLESFHPLAAHELARLEHGLDRLLYLVSDRVVLGFEVK